MAICQICLEESNINIGCFYCNLRMCDKCTEYGMKVGQFAVSSNKCIGYCSLQCVLKLCKFTEFANYNIISSVGGNYLLAIQAREFFRIQTLPQINKILPQFIQLNELSEIVMDYIND